jgi:uncharacterized protein YbjQ (UPF0145 family)
VLLIVASWLRRWRERRAFLKRRAELRETYGDLQLQQKEVERLSGLILATSSTKGIVGFAITRQIEAVFVEGQRSPQQAVEMLKARAAEKGANAVINLQSQRLPSGKCVASGDAVIVRPVADMRHRPPAPKPPEGGVGKKDDA